MAYRVLLFASYADALGTDAIEVDAPSPATAGDLLRAVQARITRPVPPRPMMAVNAAYASLDQVVAEGDEVAIIPPVAGG